jgi:hypothetical protein
VALVAALEVKAVPWELGYQAKALLVLYRLHTLVALVVARVQ